MRYTEFSRNKKENEMKRIKREEAQRTGIAYLPSKLIVSGNASATANNIATYEALFALGILSDLFTATTAIFLTLALYRLFKGVDEGLARLW